MTPASHNLFNPFPNPVEVGRSHLSQSCNQTGAKQPTAGSRVRLEGAKLEKIVAGAAKQNPLLFPQEEN